MYRVLIIDDEAAICRMLTYALSRKGIEAFSVPNGVEGIKKFNEEHFDIVVTDVCIPGMNGNSVAQFIRNSQKYDTPIIGISGTEWLLDKNQFDAVFQKPSSIHTLIDAVQVFRDKKAA